MVSKDYQRRTASIWYQSACLLDAPVYPAKTAEPIGMLFGGQTRVRSVEEFTDYDSVVVFLAVARAYIAKFFVTSH